MQEPKTDQDESRAQRINELLGSTSTPSLQQSQLMQILSGGRSQQPSSQRSRGPVQQVGADQLQRILSSIGLRTQPSQQQNQQTQQQSQQQTQQTQQQAPPKQEGKFFFVCCFVLFHVVNHTMQMDYH